jgi:hypothetical protein
MDVAENPGEKPTEKPTEKPKTHMKGWTKEDHYTHLGCWCGQSCPCCRAEHDEVFGSCDICINES